MKTYWDYTEKERSEMTEDFVRSLLDAELMTKGVLKVDPPALMPVPVVPEIENETWYEVAGIHFRTAEQAAQFLVLDPHTSDYDYSAGGSDFRYAKQISIPYECDITPKKLYSRDAVLRGAKILKEIKAVTSANEKAEREYQEASQAVDKILSGVWDDWQDQRDHAKKCQKVLDTLEEYKRLTDGNAYLAFTFLQKAYDNNTIEDAFKFLELPDPFIRCAATEAPSE